MITTIGFDADDTLWHNETIFEATHRRYEQLLARYHNEETVKKALYATEMRNLDLFGYGIKGFTLSAIETAIDLTNGAIQGDEIRSILQYAKDMMQHPVELLHGVAETVGQLAAAYDLVLITKGDLRDQERKFRQSGLASHFRYWEIVAEKDAATYSRVLGRHHINPETFLMVGNSLKSDVLPALALGAAAVFIPYPLTWAHERAEAPKGNPRFYSLDSIAGLPALVRTIDAG